LAAVNNGLVKRRVSGQRQGKRCWFWNAVEFSRWPRVYEEILSRLSFLRAFLRGFPVRPEIIPNSDLPRQRPGDSSLRTFCRCLNGDYLWRVNDHAENAARNPAALAVGRRSVRRFSKLMTPMCRFVKPLAFHDSPGPDNAESERLKAV